MTEAGAPDAKPGRTLTEHEIQMEMAAIEGSAALAGHTRSQPALDRAERILRGQMTSEEAWAEFEAELEALGYRRKQKDADDL
jgi:hypothetical protein